MTKAGTKLRGADRRHGALPWIASGLVALAAILGAAALPLRAFTVESPSMGTAAPVGSLVITSHRADVEPGAIVTFRPVSGSARTYTHRVIAVGPNGITTQGDLNATPDPWTVSPDQVVGRAVAVLPGFGYAARVLAFTTLGTLLAVGATRGVGERGLRRCLRFDGAALALAGAIAVVKPLTGFRLLAVAAEGAARADVVSTSVLPITVRPHDGSTAADLAYGQAGTLTAATDHGVLTLHSALHLPWFGWVALAVFCLIPTVVAVAQARSRSVAVLP